MNQKIKYLPTPDLTTPTSKEMTTMATFHTINVHIHDASTKQGSELICRCPARQISARALGLGFVS